MAQQGSRRGRPPQPAQGHRSHRESPESPRPAWQRRDRPERSWQADPFADSDVGLPAWAEPSADPDRATRTLRRSAPPASSGPGDDGYDDAGLAGPGEAGRGARPPRRRGRAAATRIRKSRRRVYRWCATAIVLCVVGAGIAILVTHRTPQRALYVTSLLSGEYKSVPSACTAVSAATLNQYLPGPGRTSANEVSDSTSSQCSFTVDHKPDFLVLEVSAQAYQPFAAATGSGGPAGSASANAQENFAQLQLSLAKPPRRSPLTAAQVTPLPATGQQAFVAVQTEHVAGIRSDVVTVAIRERNVVITVTESAQESGHGFGPVPLTTMQAGAEAAAREALAKAKAEPRA